MALGRGGAADPGRAPAIWVGKDDDTMPDNHE